MSPENLPFYWSVIFVRRLYEQGLKHVVISPGSRSTPLTLAFAAHKGIEKHVVVDERSAAFVALGIGKSTQSPAALVCTSGTAVANYLPAVIEARQSNTPLIVLSADRPANLQGIGASQTINQEHIFGNYTGFFLNMDDPIETDRDLARLRRAADQAISEAEKGKGVAHINFPFKKPLEPAKRFFNTTLKENDEIVDLFVAEAKNLEASFIELNDHIWSNMVAAERPVIVVGPRSRSANTDSIISLAHLLKAPILASAGSHIPIDKHIIQSFDGFLRTDQNQESLKPDLIIRFGKQPISKALFNYMRNNLDIQQIVFTDHQELADETLTATDIIHFQDDIQIPEISGAASSKWLKKWVKAEKEFKNARTEIISSANTLTDTLIFQEASKLIPEDSFQFLSNSFPVRDFELISDYSENAYVNRGAAGIDGILSTAIGLSIGENKAGVAFVGDLAFIHDSNGLRAASEVKKPLIIILLNNGGGTIFRMLPISNLDQVYESYFETPQHVSFTHLCRAHEVSHRLVTNKEQFRDIFTKALGRNKLQVIECITNPNSSMKSRSRLWDIELDLK